MDCKWGSHSAAALLRVNVILVVRAKKLVSVEDAPSALLRGEDKYPHKLRVSGLMENLFDGP